MIEALREWSGDMPVALVVAVALLVFLAALAVLVVVSVAVGAALGRLALPPRRDADRPDAP